MHSWKALLKVQKLVLNSYAPRRHSKKNGSPAKTFIYVFSPVTLSSLNALWRVYAADIKIISVA